jgi:glycosyltransferase involved in cell wall biosynthesis
MFERRVRMRTVGERGEGARHSTQRGRRCASPRVYASGAVRILFLNDLCDPRIGSSIRLMYQEAEELRARGHETVVVSTTKRREEVGVTELAGSEVHRIHSDYPPRFRSWVSLNNRGVVAELRRILGRWKPDVVHSHLIHSNLSYASLTAAREAGAGVVFTAHDSMTYCYQKLDCFHGGPEANWEKKEYTAHWTKCIPCQRLRYRPGRNAAIRKVLARDVHRFTVVTDELGVAVRANGIRVDRTINNAIALQPRRPTAKEISAFRARFALEGKLVIAMGGRLHELKGIMQLFEMLAALRREFGDLRLLVMGKEDAYRGFEQHARELGVDDIVVPTGWLEGNELLCAYGALDVMVSPSICFETFGMLSLEAMEFEKPVVVNSNGGCPEVVEDGQWGFVANPYDIATFAECIARLLRDPALRGSMGRAGRARLEEHFTIRRMTDE